MQILRRGWLSVFALLIAFLLPTPLTRAQIPGTPVAGTPIAFERPLDGRLGGSLDTIVARFGEPDFTGADLIRYNEISLGGLPTILVVYFDASDIVTRLALVYRQQPAILADTIGIMSIAGTVSPEDGICDTSPVANDRADQFYRCHSDMLAATETTSQADIDESQSEPGEYVIAIDPLPDAYFELIIQLGNENTPLAPTPIADVPAVAATPSLDQQYPPLTKPSDLADGDIALHASLSFSGEIMTLQIAEFGKQFRLGTDQSLGVSVLFQVKIPVTGSGDPVVFFVGYNGDASPLTIGQNVTVYGTNYGIQCFDNALHKEICQPLIAADSVSIDTP